jgi:hypothetical protein
MAFASFLIYVYVLISYLRVSDSLSLLMYMNPHTVYSLNYVICKSESHQLDIKYNFLPPRKYITIF